MLRPGLSRFNLLSPFGNFPNSFCASRNSATPSQRRGMALHTSTSVRIAIVGDVHDDWDAIMDEKALQLIKPDLVLFTGDFGEENVELVQLISHLNFPKAVILGNHDSWWTTGPFQRYNPNQVGVPYGVRMQLEALGESHVGYSRLDFSSLGVSVVGGRPFSCGGKKIWSQKLLAEIYGVIDLKASAERIIKLALTAPAENSLIFLAHNGPTGLGSEVHDICGRDWIRTGGDHGDSDLKEALNAVLKIHRRKIPLVVFGHMHKTLQMGLGERTMLVHGKDGVVYLNGAVVPRVKPSTRQSHFHEESREKGHSVVSDRHFTVVELVDNVVTKVVEKWICACENACYETETVLYMQE